MSIFNVRHVTTYRYRRPVVFGDHRLLFRPRDSHDQMLLHAELVTDPAPARLRWIHDVFGNCVAIVSFEGPARELRFESRIRLDHTPRGELAFDTDPAALRYPFSYAAEEAGDLASTMRPHYPDDRVTRWARQFVRADGRTETGHLLMTMCYAIHEGFAYARRHEHGTQSPARTLALRRGTCRDFALLMMECLRALGFAARFVSGYVYVPDRDDGAVRGGGSTHAWCEVYLPGAGWVEFDPTNGIVGSRDLIRVAVARDPSQAIPLSGTYTGAAEDFLEMEVGVQVTTEPGALQPIE
ncbi:transglutaminase family protein [Amaricoccus solimangrovi]|uniref:Transglutaminase family protein n=1 Tax=Amaricoccus solimangrovi TaxID=2589815 RepID=A0A501WUW9_9RHOB|nr:transglutaminase family protein [Amaricoccus solimangrovi]TPE52532.1 transglutaminase family protein [Amaricoccus solimangrovi]